MKLKNIFIITLLFVSSSIVASATELNGRVSVLNNDGSNYQVMLQINTDLQSQKMGGATMVIDFDTTLLSFPDIPSAGTDYIFSNFNLGFYDTATVTKVSNGKIWLNIDLTSDGHGTLVEKGPDSWTDLVMLNFESANIVANNPISWNINSKYWQVYDEDNFTVWNNGNFDFITNADERSSGKEIAYTLDQNYPNPFNPTTTIQYSVPERSMIRLDVYNIIGEQVSVLTQGEKEAGIYSVEFNAANLPSGIYIYAIHSIPIGKPGEKFVQTRKMVLLK